MADTQVTSEQSSRVLNEQQGDVWIAALCSSF